MNKDETLHGIHYSEIPQDFTGMVILKNKSKIHFKNGKFHRENDLPACEWSDGSLEFYIDGLLHRDNDEPAVILMNGIREWFKYGLRHRKGNKPAYITKSGYKEYWVEGVRQNVEK